LTTKKKCEKKKEKNYFFNHSQYQLMKMLLFEEH